MDAALVVACDDAGSARLAPALAAMGYSKIIQLLGARESFQPGATVKDTDLGSFATDMRRERAAETAADVVCGGYPGLPAGAGALPLLRALILAARMYASGFIGMGTPVGGAPAPAPTPASSDPDDLKPLPPKTIDDIWIAGDLVTGGFSTVLPANRLSDSIVSRMARANKAGSLWLPAVDGNFAYKEPSTTRARITTLLKEAGATPHHDVQLQLVQSGQSMERPAEIDQPIDYDSVCRHRSAALVACYSSVQASAEYAVSARFASLQRHASSTDASKTMQISPLMIALLEGKLLEVAKNRSLSIADILVVDRQVMNAIMSRFARVKVDGSLAIEYVIDSMPGEFVPHGVDGRPSTSLAQLQGGGGFPSSPGGSQANSDYMSSVSRQGDDNGMKRRLGEMERERNDLRSRLKQVEGSTTGGGSKGGRGGGGKQIFGGDAKRMGGGNPRGPQVCGKFNTHAGCSMERCNFMHVCNKDVGGGRTCRNDRHCAIHH